MNYIKPLLVALYVVLHFTIVLTMWNALIGIDDYAHVGSMSTLNLFQLSTCAKAFLLSLTNILLAVPYAVAAAGAGGRQGLI